MQSPISFILTDFIAKYLSQTKKTVPTLQERFKYLLRKKV